MAVAPVLNVGSSLPMPPRTASHLRRAARASSCERLGPGRRAAAGVAARAAAQRRRALQVPPGQRHPLPDRLRRAGRGGAAAARARRRRSCCSCGRAIRPTETWTGRRAGVEGAVRDFGADAGLPGRRARRQAGRDRRGRRGGALPVRARAGAGRRGRAPARAAARRPSGAAGARRCAWSTRAVTLHEMRLVKSPDEIAIAAPGRRRSPPRRTSPRCARRAPGVQRARDRGAHRLHLPPARRHGPRLPDDRRRAAPTPPSSTTSRTAPPLARGQLLLIDAGCEVDGYTADVTRTFPVGAPLLASRSGASTRRCWRRSRPPSRRSSRARRSTGFTRQVVARADAAAGRAGHPRAARSRRWSRAGAYKPFYMHRTSHWLGMDVHDVGFYSRERRRAPAGARHGADHRARPLHRRGRRRAARVPRPRRAHRGRHPGHRRPATRT